MVDLLDKSCGPSCSSSSLFCSISVKLLERFIKNVAETLTFCRFFVYQMSDSFLNAAKMCLQFYGILMRKKLQSGYKLQTAVIFSVLSEKRGLHQELRRCSSGTCKVISQHSAQDEISGFYKKRYPVCRHATCETIQRSRLGQ